jgi:hypothetical protein
MLRCTAKVFKELGIAADESGVLEDTSQLPLGDWFVNLFWCDRRKCVLFTSSTTLLSFVVCDVFRSELRPLRQFFLVHFSHFLQYQRVPSELRSHIIQSYSQTPVGKTNNRSVLGSMNDIMNNAKYLAARSQQEGKLDPLEISRCLSDIPMASIDSMFPWKAARVALGLETPEEAAKPVGTLNPLARRIGSPSLMVINGAKK